MHGRQVHFGLTPLSNQPPSQLSHHPLDFLEVKMVSWDKNPYRIVPIMVVSIFMDVDYPILQKLFSGAHYSPDFRQVNLSTFARL